MPPDSDVGPRSAKPLRSYAVVVFALIIGLFLGVLSVGSIGWAMLSGNSGQALLSHVWSAVTGSATCGMWRPGLAWLAESYIVCHVLTSGQRVRRRVAGNESRAVAG